MVARSKAWAALAALREELPGAVSAPGDAGYGPAGGALAGSRPAVYVRCADAGAVVRAVRFARDLDLPVAVRGGGRGRAGAAADGAVVADLRGLDGVEVDPVARTARVGGGATPAGLRRAARPYGLAANEPRGAGGVCPYVLTAGPGLLDRVFGSVVGDLVAVELVTADAGLVRADAGENPELFWALHGGGGGFGAVVSLTLRLHERPETAAELLRCPPEAAPAAVRAFRDAVAAGPDGLGGTVTFRTSAAGPVCEVLVTRTGAAGAPPMPTAPSGGAGAAGAPAGARHRWSAACLAGLPDELLDAVLAVAWELPAGDSRLTLFPQGGATASATAGYPVAYPDAPWVAYPHATWDDPAEDARAGAWPARVLAALEPWRTGACCLDLTGDAGPAEVAAGVGAGSVLRLEKVKRAVDRDDVFRFAPGVRPL